MKSRNKTRRLDVRVVDFAKGPQAYGQDGKKKLRWATGGYHKPGSLNK